MKLHAHIPWPEACQWNPRPQNRGILPNVQDPNFKFGSRLARPGGGGRGAAGSRGTSGGGLGPGAR